MTDKLEAPPAGDRQGPRSSDQLGSSIGSDNSNAASKTQVGQLVRTIKAHIAAGDKAKDKAEQHYISAGQHLKTLKAEHAGTWDEWEALLKDKVGIGKSRASELMQIADGRKTVEQVKEESAERKANERKRISLRDVTENAEPARISADAMRSKFSTADGDARTEEIEKAATTVAHQLVKHAPAVAREIYEFTDDHWWPFVEALRRELEPKPADAVDHGLPTPQQDFSFGLEVTTKDGKVWASGVRLPTEEEAKFYIDYWARRELGKHGYVTRDNDPNTDVLAFDIKRYDERPRMRITGRRRKTLNFEHGTCGLLGWEGWRPTTGGECECKKCKRDRERREAEAREYEIGESALAAGEISQEQYDEWMDLPFGKHPEWLARLMRSRPVTNPPPHDDGLDIPDFLRREPRAVSS